RTKPDACVVAVSHSANESVTEAVLEAGLPVLAEKPVAFTSAGVERLAELASARGVLAMAAMNRRFYPGVLDGMRSGRYVGGLVGVTLFAPDPVRARRAGGTHAPFVFDAWIIAQTLHAIDLLRMTAGEAPFPLAIERSEVGNEPNYVTNYRS